MKTDRLLADAPRLMRWAIAAGLARLPAPRSHVRPYRDNVALAALVRQAIQRQAGMFRHADLGLRDVPPVDLRRALRWLHEQGELKVAKPARGATPATYARRGCSAR